MKTNVKNILILIDSSWGEIDWILPVCHYIKKNYPNITMSVLFNHLDSEMIIKGNNFFRDLLSECIDYWYETKDLLIPPFRHFIEIFMKIYRQCPWLTLTPYQERFIFKLFFKRIPLNENFFNEISPDVFLKDETQDIDAVRKKIIALVHKHKCREIIFPHSTCIYNIPISKKSDISIKESQTHVADDLLCNTEKMSEYLINKNEAYRIKSHIVGIPRYDEWWIKYLINYWEKNRFKNKFIDQKLTNFLLYTVRSTARGFSEKDLKQTLYEIVETVLFFPNSFLIIKPHPRQNLVDLKRYLKKYDKNRWIIDQSQAMCLSSIADIVICMGGGTTILDSLVVNKPAIQYKGLDRNDAPIEYKKSGLAPTTSNIEELRNWIVKLKSNPNEERRTFIENLRKIIPKSKDDATKKAVNVILGFE